MRAIYDAHYPPRENFEPSFRGGHAKGLPQSEESVLYLGDFYYQASAINYAARHHLPLLDDGSWLRLPFHAPYKDNAPSLAALLAIESAGLVLPDLPLMTAQELVDFRMENIKELQNFRASMLRYAKTLNAEISEGASIEEVHRSPLVQYQWFVGSLRLFRGRVVACEGRGAAGHGCTGGAID